MKLTNNNYQNFVNLSKVLEAKIKDYIRVPHTKRRTCKGGKIYVDLVFPLNSTQKLYIIITWQQTEYVTIYVGRCSDQCDVTCHSIAQFTDPGSVDKAIELSMERVERFFDNERVRSAEES